MLDRAHPPADRLPVSGPDGLPRHLDREREQDWWARSLSSQHQPFARPVVQSIIVFEFDDLKRRNFMQKSASYRSLGASFVCVIGSKPIKARHRKQSDHRHSVRKYSRSGSYNPSSETPLPSSVILIG